MVFGYIGAALAVGILIGVIALAIGWMSKRVTDNINRRTLGLISSYDELLNKKSMELRRLEQNAPVRTAAPSPVVNLKPAEKTDDAVIMNYAELMSSSTYLGNDYGSIYKKIRDGFNIRPEDAIAACVTPVYQSGPATQLLQELDYDTVYRLSSLSREEQYVLMAENLFGAQRDLLDKFMVGRKSFSSIDFYDFLQIEAVSEPHKATLYVSQRDADKYYPGDVNVVVNDDICEGFQIEADNKLYEYSIKEREIM